MVGLINQFFAWWKRELLACLPAVLRGGGGPSLELALGATKVELLRLGPEGARSLGMFDRDAATPAEARRRGARAGARTIVRLAPGAALRARIGLPSAAASDLRSAVEGEMDRHTPFRAEDVRFDLRVEGADPDLERVFVEIEVARRDDVDAAIAAARLLGLRPARVCGAGREGAEETSARPFDLTPPEVREAPRGGRLVAGLALLLVFAAAGAGYAWLDRKERTLAKVEARLDALRAEAGSAADAAGRSAARRALAVAAATRKASAPLALRLLDEAAARLPDGTWAESVEIADGGIRISGRSDEAAPLLAAIEASPFFAEARFVAPVTRDSAASLERFEIAASVTAPGPAKP